MHQWSKTVDTLSEDPHGGSQPFSNTRVPEDVIPSSNILGHQALNRCTQACNQNSHTDTIFKVTTFKTDYIAPKKQILRGL